MKKGQISVFIIVAILIIIIFGVYIIMRSSSSNNNIPLEFEGIHNFITECVKESAEESVYYVSTTGGYYKLPELSTPTEIAYYYDGRKSRVPFLLDIEKQIGSVFENIFKNCTEDYKNFKDIKIDHNNLKIKVNILDNLILFNLDYPISLSKDNKIVNFNKFNVEIPVRLKLVNKVSNEIVKVLISYNGDICINCLFDLSQKNDLYIEMYDYQLDSKIFVIRDEKLKLKGEDFVWYFASKII